jgi:hypothetical protein
VGKEKELVFANWSAHTDAKFIHDRTLLLGEVARCIVRMKERTASTTDGNGKGDRMNRFQQGSLYKAKRKGCSDVWVFRWYDYSSGKRTYKKHIVGTVSQLRSRRKAEKAIVALRSSINVDLGTPQTVCDLAAHYRAHELTQDKKSFSTIDNHRHLFKRYIEPRWGNFGSARFGQWRSRSGCILFHWLLVRKQS